MADQQSNDEQIRELALFAGAGGGILGGYLCGWRTVCAVEIDAYAASVLCARQNDGILPPFPIWDDVRTFDGRQWRGRVDIISGGFPCQDISVAGKGAGLEGARSGLWKEFKRIIGEVRPRFVLVENSPALTIRGGVRVIADLTEMGYDARWGIVSAENAGAPHERKRIWILAHSSSDRCEREWTCPKIEKGLQSRSAKEGELASGLEGCSIEMAYTSIIGRESWRNGYSSGRKRRRELDRGGFKANVSYPNAEYDDNARYESSEIFGSRPEASKIQSRDVSDSDSPRLKEQRIKVTTESEFKTVKCGDWWSTEPNVGRVAHGVAARVDRIKAIGNGQVPAVVRLACEILRGDLI